MRAGANPGFPADFCPSFNGRRVMMEGGRSAKRLGARGTRVLTLRVPPPPSHPDSPDTECINVADGACGERFPGGERGR